jgi:outer membrane protein assembly factor BamB
MKIFHFLISLLIILLVTNITESQEVLQWRGNDRSGKYPGTGLLKSWPENGPALLWEFDGLGNGYGSPVITSKNIFINGEIDSISYLFALDHSGNLIWKSKIGGEWIANYPGSRSTPTVVDDLVYVTSGLGTVACFETQTGKERWSVDMIKDFHGQMTRFGLSESVLVEDNKVYCSPGNQDTNIVALDRFSGKIVWISKGAGEITSYTSPMLIRLLQRNILVTFSKTALLGIDSKDGTVLWSYLQEGQDIDCQCNTPYYENGLIYCVNGNGNGVIKFSLSEDGSKITELYHNAKCDGLFGGFVKTGDYIYTSSYERRNYLTVDCSNGNITDSLKFDRGSVILADGMLYLYNEKGQVAVARPDGPKIGIVSSFKLTKGTKAHFSHPVICSGILYIRHGKSLMAYDVRDKEADGRSGGQVDGRTGGQEKK